MVYQQVLLYQLFFYLLFLVVFYDNCVLICSQCHKCLLNSPIGFLLVKSQIWLFFFSLFSSVLCNYFVRSHLYNKNLIVKLVKSYKWFCDEFKHSITKKICMTFKRSARISFCLMVLNYSGEAKKSPYQSKTSNWIHVFGGQ